MSDPNCTHPKVCSKCGKLKRLTDFHRHPKTKDGRRPNCKCCVKQYSDANRGKLAERSRLWHKANAEYARERSKKYREGRPEYLQQWREQNPDYARRYYEENRDAILAKVFQYSRANPEGVRARASNRRSREINAEGAHTARDIVALAKSQDWRCAYCGEDISTLYEVDHIIPLSRGGRNDRANLAISCPTCNRRKHNKTAEEFMRRLL